MFALVILMECFRKNFQIDENQNHKWKTANLKNYL